MRRGCVLPALALWSCGRLDYDAPHTATDGVPPGVDSVEGFGDAAATDTTLVTGPCSWDPVPTFRDVAPVAELNTSAFEGDPTLSADGLTIFYYDGEGLHLARRPTRAAPFGPREPIPTAAPLDPTANGFFLADDGVTALLAIDAPPADGNSDVYTTVRSDPSATFPAPVAVPELNGAFNEFNARISPDGQDLVFLKWSGMVPATARLHLAHRQTGSWGNVQQVFPASAVLETSGSFVGDSLHIVFGREQDLFTASRPSTADPFGAAMPVDPIGTGLVNTNSLEMIPFASRDGCELFFVSDRPGGSGGWDLWRATVQP